MGLHRLGRERTGATSLVPTVEITASTEWSMQIMLFPVYVVLCGQYQLIAGTKHATLLSIFNLKICYSVIMPNMFCSNGINPSITEGTAST